MCCLCMSLQQARAGVASEQYSTVSLTGREVFRISGSKSQRLDRTMNVTCPPLVMPGTNFHTRSPCACRRIDEGATRAPVHPHKQDIQTIIIRAHGTTSQLSPGASSKQSNRINTAYWAAANIAPGPTTPTNSPSLPNKHVQPAQYFVLLRYVQRLASGSRTEGENSNIQDYFLYLTYRKFRDYRKYWCNHSTAHILNFSCRQQRAPLQASDWHVAFPSRC